MKPPRRPKLLIIEDDEGLRAQLKWALSGYDFHMAADRPSGMALFSDVQPNVVILDLGLPPDRDNASEGLLALSAMLALRPLTKVIIASGNEDRRIAVEAIRLGAYDFYAKPVDQDVLKIIIERAWSNYQLEEEVDRLREGLEADHMPFHGLVAGSPEMLKVCHMAERVASSDVRVVLSGESGTGKEVLARAIHTWSRRAACPFIAINCAAIPENLLETELFGHEKGAFTGAVSQVVGKVETAHKGTLFLDEIGDMPPALQAKLLRFLQEKVIERVGGRKSIMVDVRVIAATNRDLHAMMKQGEFREDLFYRLDEVDIRVPPLRERPGDAVLIAMYLLKKLRADLDRGVKGLSPEAIAAIESYSWPGNVRELENRIKRALVMANHRHLTVEDLDLPDSTFDPTAVVVPTLKQAREDAERRAVSRTLAATDNNIQKASKLLGVSRPTLYALMKALRISKESAD
jgi:two-component system NtrC family response regulator